MRTIRVRVIANGETYHWASWQAKIAAVRAFWAPICNIEIEVRKATLSPVFQRYTPDSDLYIVDLGWYDKNVSEPNRDAGTVIFLISDKERPAPAGMVYGGVMSFNQPYPELWEIQVFGNEKDDAWSNSIAMGNDTVLKFNHELSHRFYVEKGGIDRTHEHFYAGHPERVYDDLREFLSKEPVDTPLQRLMKALILLLQQQVRQLTIERMNQQTTPPEKKRFPLDERIVSGYDYAVRTTYTPRHLGVDWKANKATLYAPCRGTIVKAFTGGEGGKTIWFRPEGEKTIIRWLHLDQFKCKEGQTVEKGIPIAITGSTGNSKGAHLHEDIWPAGSVTLKFEDTVSPHSYY